MLPSWSSSRPAASLVWASVTAVNMHLCCPLWSPALPCFCLIHTVLYTHSLDHKTSHPWDPCPISLTSFLLSLRTHRVPDHSDPAPEPWTCTVSSSGLCLDLLLTWVDIGILAQISVLWRASSLTLGAAPGPTPYPLHLALHREGQYFFGIFFSFSLFVHCISLQNRI